MPAVLSTLLTHLPPFPSPSFLHLPTSPYPHLLTTSLALLLTSESLSYYPGSYLFKLTTSTTFLLSALSSYPTLSPTSLISNPPYLLLGLTLSFLGDYLLIPTRAHYHHPPPSSAGTTPSFRAGTISFGLAHLAYSAAFLSHPLTAFNARGFWTVLAAGVTLGGGIASRVEKKERGLVAGYAAVITSMVGTAVATGGGQRLYGAAAFLASDLFVAWDAFGKGEREEGGRGDGKRKGVVLRGVGWVLYFGAQLVIAGLAPM